MTVKLFVQAMAKFALGVVLVGLLIFLPAGTFAFSGGWLLMGILFVPILENQQCTLKKLQKV